MSRTASYQIIDEPRPAPLARLAVQPLWIFLGALLGGAWLAWPWFVLNTLALGSATRRRELSLVLAGLLGSAAGILGVFVLAGSVGPGPWVKYALLPVTVYKLVIYYHVFLAQSRSAELFTYFGGELRPGLLVMIAGALLRSGVLSAWDHVFWALLAG